MTAQILCGDARKILKTLEPDSVHCCVTSPPYFGLRDYGHDCQIGLEKTIDGYVGELVSLFDEVARVLRSDGTLWLNLGDSYARTGGTDKKPSSSGVAGNNQRAIENRGDRTQKGLDELANKQLIGIPWRVAFALQAAGWWLRQDIIWHKPNPMPSSVTDRCTGAHEYIFLLSRSPQYYFDHEAIRETAVKTGTPGHLTSGRGKRTKSRDGLRGKQHTDGKRTKRSVWTIPVKPFTEAHFATYPVELITPAIVAGCPEGGTVLDPFGGAGTTALAAERLGRNSVLIELNPEYADLAHNRLKAAMIQTTGHTSKPASPGPLFGGEA